MILAGERGKKDMNDLLTEYKEYLRIKNYKPRTIQEKEREIKKYLEYSYENQINIYSIGIREAENYREYLRLLTKKNNNHSTSSSKCWTSASYNPKTINKIISFLRLFYAFLITKQ